MFPELGNHGASDLSCMFLCPHMQLLGGISPLKLGELELRWRGLSPKEKWVLLPEGEDG